MGIKHKPTSIKESKNKITLEKLAIHLQEVDDTAIELYEANLEQQEINTAQDDALIELYENLIGGN